MKEFFKKENNTDILLSVSTITYNNPEELRRFLNDVLPQMESGVEIVVSDNSTDNRIKLMVEKEFNSPYVRYFKNESNVGFDGNILFAIERAKGKYVWWFGNDGMEKGAIKDLVGVLRKYPDISFVFVNFYINDQWINNPFFKLSQDKFFKDRNEALKEIANVLGFMSTMVFKREGAVNVDKEKMQQFIGSGFINFYLILHILSQPGKFYFLSYPYVSCYPALPTEIPHDGWQIYGVNFLEITKSFRDKFNKKSLKKMLAKNFGHLWRGLLVGWVKGYPSPHGFRSPRKRIIPMLKCYWNFPEFWIVLPFFLMPRFINVFLYKSYKKLTRNNEYIKQKLSKVPWF